LLIDSRGKSGGTPLKKVAEPLGFRVIGALKLASGVLSLGVAIGLTRLFRGDLPTNLEHSLSLLRLDPDNHYIHMAISWIAGISRKHLHEIEAGTFFYSILHIVEGTGLLLGMRWAGYLTVGATSSLIPLEVLSIFHKFHVAKLLVLFVNIAIVVYLVVKLRKELRSVPAAPPGHGSQATV
jgi:uncharacterized membrane protein (DUF2068 family)